MNLLDHLRSQYMTVNRAVRNAVSLEDNINDCIARVKNALTANTVELKKVMQTQLEGLGSADFDIIKCEQKLAEVTSTHRLMQSQIVSLNDHKLFVEGCKNNTFTVLGQTIALQTKKCNVCREMVAEKDSLKCSNGCHNCLDCIYGEIESRKDQQKLFYTKNVFKCFTCSAIFKTDAVITRLATASANGTGAASIAIRDVLYCEQELARLDARTSTIVEYRKRAAESPSDSLLRICQGLYCPSCDALYDTTTEGQACMHATCSSCSAKFCGFCFELDCDAKDCILNPKQGSIFVDNKNAASLVCKAYKIANALDAYSPSERVTVLDSLVDKFDELANGDGGFDINTASLFLDYDCAKYVGDRVMNQLHKIYRGKDGTNASTIDYNSFCIGDIVVFTRDKQLMDNDILNMLTINQNRVAAIEPTIDYEWATSSNTELLANSFFGRVVCSDDGEPTKDWDNTVTVTNNMDMDGEKSYARFTWIRLHVSINTVFKKPDVNTLKTLTTEVAWTTPILTGLKAKLVETTTLCFSGDLIYIDRSVNELRDIFNSEIVVENDEDGSVETFEPFGWHADYAKLIGKWWCISGMYPESYGITMGQQHIAVPQAAFTHIVAKAAAYVALIQFANCAIKNLKAASSGGRLTLLD